MVINLCDLTSMKHKSIHGIFSQKKKKKNIKIDSVVIIITVNVQNLFIIHKYLVMILY